MQPSTQLTIRLTDPSYDAVHEAAKNLKARWIVMLEEHPTGVREWGVFDMRKASRDITGTYFPEPTKLFPYTARDAAEMYAVMLAGRS